MIDTNKLNAHIVANGLTKRDVARLIGISETSMYNKMSKGVFGSNEMAELIKVLHIPKEEVVKFFFAD